MSDVLCVPEFTKWASLISPIDRTVNFLGKALPIDLLQGIRQQVATAAVQFTRQCAQFGNYQEKSEFNLEMPIAAFGHQPLVYHCGLLAKQEKLIELATYTQLNLLEIIIDTDQGQSVTVSIPEHIGGHTHIKTLAVTKGPGLYMFHKIDLSELKTCDIANQQLASYLKKLSRFVGLPPAAALTAIRHADIKDQQTLFIPISHIMKLPAILQLMEILLSEPVRLAEIYNQTLNEFRKKHKINNAANPFPNLQINQLQCELPFWVIDNNRQSRTALIFDRLAEKYMPDTYNLTSLQLSPRGMLTTFIIRLFCSDFFVHGLGGGKYDPATDEFIKLVVGVEPPKYVVTTANRYLFADQHNKLLNIQSKLEAKHQVYNHPELVLDELSDPEIRTKVQLLCEKVKVLRELLVTERKTGQSVAPVQRQLAEIKLEIRAILDQEYFNPFQIELERLQPSLAAITARNFSYFLFD